MKTLSSAPSHRQGGFSLLEVLIAVLIFSIGLLGLAGLQIIAMKANQNAMLRSIASEIAYDALDLVRAQPATAKAAGGDCNAIAGYDDLVAYATGDSGSLPGGAIDCSLSGTLASELKATVTVTWSQASVTAASGASATPWQTSGSAVETVTVTGSL